MILRQPLDGPHHPGRHDHPADAPAGHAVVFRETVDDERLVRQRQRGNGLLGIPEPVVDLVRDHRRPVRPAIRDQRGERLARQGRAGRVGRAGEEETVDAPPGAGLGEEGRVGLVARRQTRLQPHRLDIDGGQDVAVAGVARIGQRQPRARVEQRQEGEQEARRGAGRDHDALRRDVEAVHLGVHPRQARAQGRHAEGDGVAERVPVRQRPHRRLPRRAGGRGAGLADLQMRDPRAALFGAAGGLHDIHGEEGSDVRAAGRFSYHARLCAGYRRPPQVGSRGRRMQTLGRGMVVGNERRTWACPCRWIGSRRRPRIRYR